MSALTHMTPPSQGLRSKTTAQVWNKSSLRSDASNLLTESGLDAVIATPGPDNVHYDTITETLH